MSYEPRPISLQAGLELLGVRGHHVEVPVEDHGGCAGRCADRRGDHRQALELEVLDLDVARLEPPADEAGGVAQAVERRRVRRDQPLCQHPFVHDQRV
jgi:hypothetical protein